MINKDRTPYLKELSEISSETTEKIIAVADKYKINRDETMQRFALIFQILVGSGTFEYWEKEGDGE